MRNPFFLLTIVARPSVDFYPGPPPRPGCATFSISTMSRRESKHIHRITTTLSEFAYLIVIKSDAILLKWPWASDRLC